MSKHSPKPWTFEKKHERSFGFTITSSDGEEIVDQDAHCFSSDQETREDNELGVGFPIRGDRFTRDKAVALIARQDADGMLMAAAPDLLEVVALVKAIADGQPPPKLGGIDWPYISGLCKSAIAKATGE